MSLMRLIVWSSLIGGWSAFFGWMVSEVILHNWINNTTVAIAMATLVAVPIGGGICCASGLTSFQLNTLIKRLLFGLAAGFLGGLLGSLAGSCAFGCFRFVSEAGFMQFVGRVFGWTFIGVGIGAGIGIGEGLIDRSFNKLRNGLIGGVLGGFLGGLFFGLVAALVTERAVTGRAVSFVLLGLCIGFFIGLAQVVLKEAWLTVEAGFRPGRQMILGNDLITMGTSEKASLIFIAYGAKGVEPVHLKISKQPDGRYLLEDNQSRGGTLLNGQPISAPTVLLNGDAIQLGVNVVRFNERAKHGDAKLPPPVITQQAPKPPVPSAAITAKPPVLPSAIQPAPMPAPKPAPPAKPVEGRCPICDKKVVGIPGERRCGKCFTSF